MARARSSCSIGPAPGIPGTKYGWDLNVSAESWRRLELLPAKCRYEPVCAGGRRYRGPFGRQYVITLDTDTQLPRDAAWQCVAAMAHPLNRARIDHRTQIVTEGYGSFSLA